MAGPPLREIKVGRTSLVVQNLPASIGDMGSIQALGRLHMLWYN